MSRPVVVFPDAIAVWRAGLLERLELFDVLDGIRVADSKPADPLANPRFVVLDRTGGTRSSIVTDTPQITLDSYGEHVGDAWDIAQAVRALTLAMAGEVVAGVTVGRVEEAGGPGRLVDPDLGVEFVRFTATAILRGAAPA